MRRRPAAASGLGRHGASAGGPSEDLGLGGRGGAGVGGFSGAEGFRDREGRPMGSRTCAAEARRPLCAHGHRQEQDRTRRRARWRGLGVVRAIQHDDGARERDRRPGGDRGKRRPSADPAVQCGECPGRGASGGLRGKMDGRKPRHTQRVFRGELFLRPGDQRAAGRASGPDQRRGDRAGRVMDRRGNAPLDAYPFRDDRQPDQAGRQLQRHDRAADPFDGQGSDLLPGRIQRRPGPRVSRRATRHHSELAEAVGTGRFSVPVRAASRLSRTPR